MVKQQEREKTQASVKKTLIMSALVVLGITLVALGYYFNGDNSNSTNAAHAKIDKIYESVNEVAADFPDFGQNSESEAVAPIWLEDQQMFVDGAAVTGERLVFEVREPEEAEEVEGEEAAEPTKPVAVDPAPLAQAIEETLTADELQQDITPRPEVAKQFSNETVTCSHRVVEESVVVACVAKADLQTYAESLKPFVAASSDYSSGADNTLIHVNQADIKTDFNGYDRVVGTMSDPVDMPSGDVYFFRPVGEADWTFVLATQITPGCDSFAEEPLQKAFADLRCLDPNDPNNEPTIQEYFTVPAES